MSCSLRTLALACALLAAWPAAVTAQIITQISAVGPDSPEPWTQAGDDPLAASVGTVFTITGTGFGGLSGTAKPKVFLTDPAKPKQKFALKVTGFSDTEVVAELKKARPVVLDLTLAAKGKGLVAAVAEGAVAGVLPDFTVDGPGTPDSVVTLAAAVGFGTAKGKLRVNGKPVKVLAWTPETVTFTTPKKLHDGLFTLTVANKLGTGVSENGLYGFVMADSGLDVGGPDRFSVKAGSKLLKAGTGFFDLLPLYDEGSEPPTLLVSAVVQTSDPLTGKPGITIAVKFPVNLETAEFPFAIEADPEGLLQLSETPAGAFFPDAGWSTEGEGDDYVVVLHSYEQNDGTGGLQLHGTFAGKLQRTLGSSGKPVLVFSKGDFKITVEPEGS